MKKQTKMTILVLFLVITMFGSTFAFLIISGLTSPETQKQEERQTAPTQYVVDGYVDFQSSQNFLARGYTLLEFHRPEGCCPEFSAVVDSAPAELGYQLIVQRIPDSRNFFLAESFRNRKTFNATEPLQLILELCDVLASPPLDCAFNQLDANATQQNSTQ